MSVNWNFKIDLKDKDVFKKINETLGITMPQELIDYVKNYNAASPDKNRILINKNERVLDANLSFNMKEKEAARFITAFNVVNDNDMIPFAIDPFGNYFCYSLKNKKIAFYSHEEQTIEMTTYSLAKFIDSLY